MAWLMGWLSGTRSGNHDSHSKKRGKDQGHSGQTGSASKVANRKPGPYLKSKPRKARKSRTGHNKTTHPSRPSPYRAVTIHPGSNGCEAANRTKHQRFLATFAPQLPLGSCDHPQQCKCRYKHHLDRRTGLRRDTDHGLPEAAFHARNRRFRRDRRHRSED
ncbi:MAG: hypothetical protein RJQ07_05785 [Pseudomonadales bacterium]